LKLQIPGHQGIDIGGSELLPMSKREGRGECETGEQGTEVLEDGFHVFEFKIMTWVK
jgi:hypothetical protein